MAKRAQQLDEIRLCSLSDDALLMVINTRRHIANMQFDVKWKKKTQPVRRKDWRKM